MNGRLFLTEFITIFFLFLSSGLAAVSIQILLNYFQRFVKRAFPLCYSFLLKSHAKVAPKKAGPTTTLLMESTQQLLTEMTGKTDLENILAEKLGICFMTSD